MLMVSNELQQLFTKHFKQFSQMWCLVRGYPNFLRPGNLFTKHLNSAFIEK